MKKRTQAFVFVVFAAAVLAASACTSTSSEPAPAVGDAAPAVAAAADPTAVQPVALPDLDGGGASEPVREQLRQQYAALTTAIADPQAEPSALGRAYGEMELAEANLQRQRLADRSIGNVEGAVIIRPNDRLMEEVESLVRSAASYELRGSRALARRDYAAATSRFREGLELQPDNPSLRHKLGTALALRGDRRASREQFEETVQRTPTYARAHYSLGVLLEEEGDLLQALARYTSAVRHDANYAEARLRLAGILRLSGRPDDAMAQYERVAQIDPAIFEAPFGKAMVLVSQDRWPEAREELEDGMAQYPSAPAFPLALARLLAAAPDGGVRDGRRAVAVMERLSEEQQRMDLGETMAMALAEAGRYDEAAALQREAIAAAPAELAPRMEANLALYESGRPSRTPWRDGEIP